MSKIDKNELWNIGLFIFTAPLAILIGFTTTYAVIYHLCGAVAHLKLSINDVIRNGAVIRPVEKIDLLVQEKYQHAVERTLVEPTI